MSKSWVSHGDGVMVHFTKGGISENGPLTPSPWSMRFEDCFVIRMEKGIFVILTGALRGSAIQMAEMVLNEVAQQMPEPFTPTTRSISRTDGQSAIEFAARVKEETRAA